MNFVRGFVPWIVFVCFPASTWQWGAVVAGLVALRLLMQDRRKGVATDALILEISTVIYFVALAVVAFAAPHSAIRDYSGAISFGWLAATALGSLAVRHPFTLGIARRTTPPEVWDTPVFRRVNTVITTVWGVVFVAICVALSICVAHHAGEAVKIVCEAVGLVIAFGFTREYPKAVRARYAAAQSS